MRPFLALVAFLFLGCGSATTKSPPPEPPIDEHEAVAEARAAFPTFADLQANVLSTTCSPNPGVCHNSNNYPNLETAGNSLTWIGAPCNTELPDPLDGWDACEPEGHVLAADLPEASFRSAIAWIEKRADGVWGVRLVDSGPATARVPVSFENADGSAFYDPALVAPIDADDTVSVTVELVESSFDAVVTVSVTDITDRQIADSILATVRGGDPNRNGIFGAAAGPPGAVIYPGDLSRSYLWGRITGTVPGSRMPLANAPLTMPAYVAIACWIETLDGSPEPEDPIDYDRCAFAGEPVDFTVQ